VNVKPASRCSGDDVLREFHKAEPGEPITRPPHISRDAWTHAMGRLRKRGFEFAVVPQGNDSGKKGTKPYLWYMTKVGIRGFVRTSQDLSDPELDLLVDLVIERIAQRARAKGRT